MHSKFKQLFYTYMLSVIVLLTMGMSFDDRNNNYSDVPSYRSVGIDTNEQIADFNKLPLIQPSTESVSFVASLPAVNNNIARVPSEPTSTVKSDSSLTEEHIAQILEGTALVGQGLEKAILEIEQEYGINAYFTIAVMKIESGHGKSQIAQYKNNLFGLNAIDSDTYNNALSFKTKGESVHKFGQLISEYYVDEGYTSIEKVASKYCQANPNWPALVMSIMESDYDMLQ